MGSARINDPMVYYAGGEDPSLFWEMTVCQSLASDASPAQRALVRPAPYGRILADFLVDAVGLAPAWTVAEVGGGYGSLMAAFLEAAPVREVHMVDVSPAFLRAQRARLGGRAECRFHQSDAIGFFRAPGPPVDLVISNENLGDLPTVVDVGREDLGRALDGGSADPLIAAVAAAFRAYELDRDGLPGRFHFNLGAVRYLEALRGRARRVFLSEHAADVRIPIRYREILAAPGGDGFPRRISLKGHDEYTIRFAHLEAVARALGYRVRRLHLAEVLGLRTDPGIRAMARAGNAASEVSEVVREFCEHLAEYQCLVLVRDEEA